MTTIIQFACLHHLVVRGLTGSSEDGEHIYGCQTIQPVCALSRLLTQYYDILCYI